MRILVVIETDLVEKGPHQTHHVMERLSLRGHEVRVMDFEIQWRDRPRRSMRSKRISLQNFSKAVRDARITIIRPNILYVPLLDHLSELFSYSKEVYRQLNEFRPDVVIGFSILNTYLALRLAKRDKIPFVYYLIDAQYTLVPFKLLRPIAKMVESQIARHADRVIVINEELRKYAINLGAKPERVSVIRAGIDSLRFNPSIDGCRVREKYGISKDDIVLFFMGWLYTFSGLREVAHSLLEAKDKHPNIKLLVVGKGDIYEELEELREKQGLNQLVLVNWQPYEKIPQYIGASDVCLLPAYNNEVMRNIVPIKMYEYMACGKPVISTRLPGIMREFGYNNGVLYVDQPTEVLEKVTELIDDGSFRDYGIKAREFVEKYSWEMITDDFEDILKDMVRSSREKAQNYEQN